MAPSRRRGTSKAAAAAAAALREWKVGDLVLAKVKGFPAWPATVSDPKKWGYPTDWKKVLVYFFGTQQIAFCNPGDVEAFTEEKKESLLGRRHGKGADFVRAVQEIIESYEKLKKQNPINEIKVEKVSHGDTNSEESSPEVLAKDLSRFPSQNSSHQSKCVDTKVKLGEEEPPLNRKDAVDVVQNEDIEYRKTSEEQIIDDVKEARLLSTYSLRRRSGGSRLESSTTKKRAPSVRRSRSSSRLYSSKVESSTLPCKDVEKFVGVSSSNSVIGGSGRRSRRTRRGVDVSKGDDLDSPSFSAYSSVEESASEILSMDSDDSHDDSAVESVSKHGRSDIGVKHAENEHVEGDFQPQKSLNLDIKTVVLKRKRKPNRKRLISDTVKLAPSNERELNFDASQNMVAPDSGVSLGNCPSENGDEHLPLVKRARVRMSKLSAAEAICSYPELEEQLPSENLSNRPPLSCSSADHDINISHPGAEAIPQDAPSLETCLQCSDVTLQVPKDVKNPQAGSTGSADVEAALPPSKRLHRALEAMSANATEPRPSSDEALLVVQMVTSECHLSPVRSSSSPQMDLDGKDINVLGKQILDSLGSGSSVIVAGGSASLDSKNSPQTAGDRMEDDDSREVSRNNECEMPEKNVENGTEVINILETPATACVIFHPEQIPSPGHLPVEENQSISRKDETSVDEVFQGRDVLNATPDIELLNCDSEGTEKVPDTSKCSARGIDHVLTAEAIDTEMQIDQVEKSESSTEMINCTDIEHLRSHEDGCSQEICKHTSLDVQHKLAHKNGTHAFSNGHLSDREESAPLESTSLSDRAHSSQRASPPTASGYHLSTSASSRNTQSSGTASPAANSRYKRPEFEPSTVQPKSLDKLSSSDEGHATLSSFEAVLGGLTRTKESIGRATRIAIDCTKFGIATKVVDSLARALEREPSLYKRVDLFFLIDSIMQCSRGLKGEAGGMYISIVQSKLSRLLSAAAPAGHSAHENRRQCLKVLRLWLERRILPESILRHHIRDLDVNGSSSAGPYSRRSARTERAFDDPIREMEGMLVDEYGSNSSFQLPGFCMPRMRKDDDEGSESDESFEAVTPERPCDAPEDGIGAPIEKRGHILQDVDGELEMEDVAPPETEINDVSTINTAPGSQSIEQQFQPPFAPPLQDIPPSSASLPLSSVPPPPPPFTSGLPSLLPNGVDQNAHRSAHDAPSNMAQHTGVHHVAPRDDHRIHEPPPYHSPDYRDRQKQITVPRNDGSYGRRPTNNFRENDGSWDHRGYPLRPPHHADQLPYVPSDQRFRSRRDPPPPSHSRYHSPHNRGNGGNHYNRHPERLKPPPHDVRENWRFSGPYSEPRYHDKARNFHPGPHDCPPYDHPRMPDHGWGYPPGPANYRNNVPFRPPYEGSHLDSFEQDPISGDHDESIALKQPSADMIRSGLPIEELDGVDVEVLFQSPFGNQLPANVRVGKQSYNNR